MFVISGYIYLFSVLSFSFFFAGLIYILYMLSYLIANNLFCFIYIIELRAYACVIRKSFLIKKFIFNYFRRFFVVSKGSK